MTSTEWDGEFSMPRFFRLHTSPTFAVGIVAIAAMGTAGVTAVGTAGTRSAGTTATGAPGTMVPGGACEFCLENQFRQTNLVSNLSNRGAQVVDPNLRNPWGLAMSPFGGPLSVANNASGTATFYKINPRGTMVRKVPATIVLPGGRASTGDGPSPTGQVFNPTGDFVVTSKKGSGPAQLIFSSEAGQISAWSPAADPLVAGTTTAQVEFSSPTAVYKGLVIARAEGRNFLYASNFHDGTVDVFNSMFHLVHLAGGFQDSTLPAGYAPFGIQEIDGFLYVSYALQNAEKHDDVAGLGHGFIDIYTNEGFLVKRLVSHDELNSPWGLAKAPEGFGPFGGDLLVGNFGDGLIHAYGLFSGQQFGALLDEQGQPLQNDGLWSLRFNTDTGHGKPTLLFSAGLNGETDGLVGSFNPVR